MKCYDPVCKSGNVFFFHILALFALLLTDWQGQTPFPHHLGDVLRSTNTLSTGGIGSSILLGHSIVARLLSFNWQVLCYPLPFSLSHRWLPTPGCFCLYTDLVSECYSGVT